MLTIPEIAIIANERMEVITFQGDDEKQMFCSCSGPGKILTLNLLHDVF